MFEFIVGAIYFFFYYVMFVIIKYLPIVTLPAAFLGIFRKRLLKRTIVSMAVVPLIKVLINFNRHGMGPTETEFFLRQLEEGSILRLLALLGYLYLIYWWITFLKDLLKQGNQKTRRLIKIGIISISLYMVIYLFVGLS